MNDLSRENQLAFFKIEGFAGKRSLSRPITPCFVELLLLLQFTRGLECSDPNNAPIS